MPKSLKQEISAELSAVRGVLEDLALLGAGCLYPEGGGSMSPGDPAPEPTAARVKSLDELRFELENCQRCALCSQRSSVVFGVGNPSAEVVFVGEAPGREEDQRGEPFVGEAGRLLDRILLAMGLDRSTVYICNVIKCRPPQNRDPLPEEIAACEPFLLAQIESIRPRLLVTLGKFAAQTLLRTDTPISRLRGKWQTYHDIPLMPTFHPAFLLRNPASKRDVWEDMKQVMYRLRGNA